MKLLDGVTARASLSPCGTYRYALFRDWFPKDRGSVLWIMLNPSTADAEVDDPTIRRCQSFSRSWGYDGIVVVNLFALRATDPAELRRHPDPVGPVNDDVIRSFAVARACPLVVAAWGVHGTYRDRDAAVRHLLRDVPLHVLDLTKDAHPRHPLYVRGDTRPMEVDVS